AALTVYCNCSFKGNDKMLKFNRSSIGGSKYLLSTNLCPEEDTLKFESRFESGNLARAIMISPNFYELQLRPDLYTNRHMQWFYFKITNTKKGRLYRIEQQNKKNNIVIFGIKKSRSDITPQYICQKLNELLDIELNELDISNLYSLGNVENSPIKVEFASYIKTIYTLKHCNKLKGKNITIAHDLTLNQRQENQILRKHLNLAKKNTNNICHIRKKPPLC
ncbi:hypothetical protein NQ317_014279, partial [Molorchus minor]